MTANGWLQIACFALAVLLVTKPAGALPGRGLRGPGPLARAARARTNYADQSHYVRVYMAQLRQKLEADPVRPRLLVTEPGVGYRLKAE
jgi:hypothetical protein